MTPQHIKKVRNFLLSGLFLILLLVVAPLQAFAALASYCAIPPFVSTGTVQPNLLFLLDMSGSMANYANNSATAPTSCSGTGWNASQTYNGYFDPTKTYYCDAVNSSGVTECSTTTGGIWHQSGSSSCAPVACTGTAGTNSSTTGTKLCVTNAAACGPNAGLYGSGLSTKTTSYFGCVYTASKPYGCCTNPPTNTAGDCGASNSGNCLNFLHMQRTDDVRWAMTGGAPKDCSSHTLDPTYCDPELWNTAAGSPNVGLVCNNSINIDSAGTAEGGCILQAIDGTLVTNSWARMNSGVIQSLETLPTQPRMGVAFFSASANALLGPKVYVGDYACKDNTYSPTTTSPWTKGCLGTSYDSSYKFKNLTTYVNSQASGGGTNTGPAMTQVLNYFTNAPLGSVPANTATSDGFFTASDPSATPTDKWRNPLYKCDYNSSGSLVCNPYPCAQNFVLLMSDGGWNTPSCTSTTSGADPVGPAYTMHFTGFTNPMSLLTTQDDKATNVSAVYTTAMFPDGVCVQTSNSTVPSSTQLCNDTTPCPSGYWCAGGTTSLENIAMYGSFRPVGAATYPGGTSGLPAGKCIDNASGSSGTLKGSYLGNCSTSGTTIYGSECTSIPSTSSIDWDKQGPAAGALPDTFSSASDANTIKTTVQNAVLEIVARATSGSAASVLASANGSGANLVQSIFYPRRSISAQPLIGWTSTLQNFWYYVNPQTGSSNIRENTDDTGSVMELNVDLDRIIHFDTSTGQTMAKLYNVDSQGNQLTTSTMVDPQVVTSLWEAGKMLWSANPDQRKIYTNLSTSTISPPTSFSGMTEFRADSTLNNLGMGGSTTLQTMLNTDLATRTAANNTTVAKNIVNYVRGWDNFCSSTMTQHCAPRFCSSTMTQSCKINADCPSGQTCKSSDTTVPDCPAGETCGNTISLTSPAETITYRSRSTAIDLDNDGKVITAGEGSKVWKLGDIIDSTPKLESWIPLNTYDQTYYDTTYNQFINSTTYKRRGMVFTGANDGMLHAFTLGLLDLSVGGMCSGTSTPCVFDNDCPTKAIGSCITGTIKAKLCQDDNLNGVCDSGESNTSNLGKEKWAFIPNGVLPYVRYLADMNYDYCHLYYVDGTPFIFDASIEAPGLPASGNYWQQTKTSSSWRTILIGSTRFGGGCNNPASIYEVQPPLTGAGTPIGYSSYFALDVTDPTSPQFLWEFSNKNISAGELSSGGLGFSTSGPAVVKIKDRTAGSPNSTPDTGNVRDGKWFVVFASGPTGPIDSLNFKGFSDQPLKLFILDLKTGMLLKTINTGIANAFGGSLNNSTMDYDFDYQDDAVYFGFTKAESATLASDIWNKGGVIRLLTRKKLNGSDITASSTAPVAAGTTALNPENWEWSYLVNNIGPVTAAVAHMAHYPLYSTIGTAPDTGFLYFGSGRYFYPLDDISTQQALYGVVEPCLANMLNPTKINDLSTKVCNDNAHAAAATACSSSSTKSTNAYVDPSSCLVNATTTPPTSATSAPNGWYINLFNHSSTDTRYNERMITDPLAAQNGAVFFTTYSPDGDQCSYGGESFLWGVKYDTAAAIGTVISGIGLLQVSTGAISEVKLGADFGLTTDATHGYGRKTGAISGVPPTGQGLSIVIPPSPTNKILYIRKR